MKELINEVDGAVMRELNRANNKFPLFASNHEAYAVILEEFEETVDELEFAKVSMTAFWMSVKEDDNPENLIRYLKSARKDMLLCACEAIQTTAMFEKAIISMEAKDKSDDVITDDIKEKWDKMTILFRDLLGIEVNFDGDTESEETEESE